MIESIKFDQNGLVPAIVQDAASKEVLTLAYMNEESLKKTLETKETWFYSRSRQELWHKGGTSGNIQKVVEMRYDCDQDAILVLVQPAGPACHTGAYTCFSETIAKQEVSVVQDRFQIFNTLEKLIAERENELPEGSYTTYLFNEGVDKILKKVGEEASEVIIASKNRDAEELKWEVADLLFHLMVLLREQKLPLDEVLSVLEKRHVAKD
ncbi:MULTISPECIES: bifunctional phosphoribosyl-AMP cyclohydrolase/phosphoribosyl-ATP diphosphatase HisIE [Metabacillus]|uniref:Histidine biosynthesis bifunctional protein HisIE n=2 Tax=Metabacillus TaxID=2675233 RepID=A0A179T5S7_9BACI|nr:MULTISPECIES: bifunctional phosphoribosyl-AMP cyclohydrolase/phosphoribosyl-ATP diphosphatase HisIE [Metabacillus]OAS88003.1 bifunctional phosphoribosyl-AMP cyclohydrolase/phosphoribosyl-ATP pyrophosphatase [Metabacillus litoralis]QNF27129.1 bifunctional phosphoribosyl-AMP cyclohydrolase/phosphoribosyl-ATP diphosphatase HisIE [Metabacillus sp. KUDC1714]